MNIDKFGHHVHKRLRLAEFIDTFSDTLVKSDTGDFDLKSSRLKGLQSPIQEDEAANKAFVDKNIEELRKEMKQIQSFVKNYLKSLETTTSKTLSTLYYTKTEIDQLIKAKSNKNE